MKAPTLTNVIDQFNALPRTGNKIGFHDGGKEMFPDLRYVSRIRNTFGYKNHFQGIVRYGRDFFISGGFPPDRTDSGADVVRMRVNSKDSNNGKIGSNLSVFRPPKEDQALSRHQLEKHYWHPGGIGEINSMLAVPMEANKQSIVRFYDLEQSEQSLKQVGEDILRPDYTAGAATISRMPDDRYILVTWSDSDKAGPNKVKHLDFYLSASDSVDCDWLGPIKYDVINYPELSHKFQSISLVWQQNDGDYKLFLVTFENSTKWAPIWPGKNIARLFEVNMPESWGSNPTQEDLPEINYKGQKDFRGSRKWCNMDAGSSAYVDHEGRLIVYSCFHFRRRGLIRCLEFPSKIADQGITDPPLSP